jgi:hypothetical protein
MNQPVTKGDFVAAKKWLVKHPGVLPPEVHQVAETVFQDYWDLLESKKNSLETLKRLREAMGILPKSERGSQEKHGPAI